MIFKALFPVIVICCCVLDISAQKTTRKGLQRTYSVAVDSTAMFINEPDTLKNPGEWLFLSGYEKPVQSRKESFHLTNASDYTVKGIEVDIVYLDYTGAELHRRNVKLKCDVPPCSTRMLWFKAWDVQNRFYYQNGPKPRKEAYPYNVSMRIVEAIVED